MTKRILLAACVLLTATTGCKTVDSGWTAKMPWSKKPELVESQYATPVRLAAIWTPDVLARPGMPASRGFGGRLYFYNQLNQPVKVEGQLVVYAYDDSGKQTQGESPDRKYAFTPEQFTSHHSKSGLGDSYSVWLPWDADPNGNQKGISLVPVFTSTAGKIVMGPQAVNLLPGKKADPASNAPAEQALSQTTPTGVRPAAFQDNRGPTGSTAPTNAISRRQSVQTTTINLPRTMQQRVIEAAQNRTASAPSAPANPSQVERARAALQELQTSSSLPAEGAVPVSHAPTTRFAPPRPRVPSSPGVRSGSSRAPSRPIPPVSQYGPPSSPQPTWPTANSGYGPAFESTVR